MQDAIRISVDPDLEDIMDRYLEIRREELEIIKSAQSEGDAEQVRFYGHRLKGTGGAYGLHELTSLGQEIEKLAEQGRLDCTAELIRRLEDYLARLVVVFDGAGA